MVDRLTTPDEAKPGIIQCTSPVPRHKINAGISHLALVSYLLPTTLDSIAPLLLYAMLVRFLDLICTIHI